MHPLRRRSFAVVSQQFDLVRLTVREITQLDAGLVLDGALLPPVCAAPLSKLQVVACSSTSGGLGCVAASGTHGRKLRQQLKREAAAAA